MLRIRTTKTLENTAIQNSIDMRLAFLFSIYLFITACQNQYAEFALSKWVYSYGSCSDFIEFYKDSTFVSYSCETGDTVYGTFSINENLINMQQEYGNYDSTFKSASRHIRGEQQFQLILAPDNTLGFIEQWNSINKEWTSDYCFRKE